MTPTVEANLGHLPLRQRELVMRGVAVLREFYDPPAIFLFGSVAKGLAHARSDIDLLVRIQASVLPRSRRMEAFFDVFGDRWPRLDVTCFTEAEVTIQMADPHSFLSSVMKRAVPLYLRDPQREPLLLKGEGARA